MSDQAQKGKLRLRKVKQHGSPNFAIEDSGEIVSGSRLVVLDQATGNQITELLLSANQVSALQQFQAEVDAGKLLCRIELDD
jgi:hypothetical protein